MKITIKIEDQDSFFNIFSNNIQERFKDTHFIIEPIISRNRININYIEPKLKQSFIKLEKHFNLAFQGGGAKGLAYVGAYKAIAEHRTRAG